MTMKFRQLSEIEYDTFARKHSTRNYLNSLNAFKIKKEEGFECLFVGIEENNQIIAASGLAMIPFLRKFKYAYAQRGLMVDYENKELVTFFVNELKKFLKSLKVSYLKIDPYVFLQQLDLDGNVVEDGFNNHHYIDTLTSLGFIHQGFTKGFAVDSQCRYMMTLNLDGKDEKQLLAEMDSQTRWSVNKSLKLGIKVRVLKEEELPLFKKIMDETASRRNFSDMSIEKYKAQLAMYKEDAKLCMAYIDLEEYKETINKDFERERAELAKIEQVLSETPNSKKFIKKQKVVKEAIALIEDREKQYLEFKKTYEKEVPLSVAYFVFYEDEAIYVSSGSIPELKKYQGPYAIQWHMIRHALENGIKRYNFYGTSGVFTKDGEDYGVYEFKKGFNALPEELLGDFILPINKLSYTLKNAYAKIK